MRCGRCRLGRTTVRRGRGGRNLERYRFTVPVGVKSVTVHGAVQYRRFRREFMD